MAALTDGQKSAGEYEDTLDSEEYNPDLKNPEDTNEGNADEEEQPQEEREYGENKKQNDAEKNNVEENEGVEEEEEEKNDPGTLIDLTNLTAKYNARSKSNLQNVLVEYGMPQNDKYYSRKKKDRPKLKREKTADSTVSDTDQEKNKIKQDYYMQVYKDIHRVRDLYYEQYVYALREKVDKQKEEIKKKSEEMENKIRRKKQEKLEAERKKKNKKVNIQHDDTYLKKIPQTQYYKIVALIDRLKKEGKLNTPTALDHFWHNIRKPEVFYSYFPPSTGLGTFADQSSHYQSQSGSYRSNSPVHYHQADLIRSLTGITEVKEPSRPPTTQEARQDWAITQQVHHKYKRAQSPKKKDAHSATREAAVELDRILPPMELPKLHCLTDLELGDKPPDPEEVLREMESRRREKERRLYVKRLRTMYQLAISNTASAQRIIDKHTSDTGIDIEGPSVAELTSGFQDMTALEYYKEAPDITDPQPWLKYVKSRSIMPIEEVPENSDTNRATSTSISKKQNRKSKHRESPKLVPMPLTLTGIEETCKTVEPKCLSSMWVNYAVAKNGVYAE